MADNHDLTPTLRQATGIWAKIGVLSFGGPAAQIALMHRLVVEEKQWLNERQFLNALSFCMLLPGPEAMQLATYAGWRLHGVVGGLIAGLLFVLPGAVVILALAGLYVYFGEVPMVNAMFTGIKAVVVIIVIEALLRVSRKALVAPIHWLIASMGFASIFFFSLPFPLLVLLAGAYGFLFIKPDTGPVEEGAMPKVALSSSLSTIGIWLVIWWAPMLILVLMGNQSSLVEIGLFFSKLAVVTFGGAYAVLAYMAQQAVENYGWLTAGAMMDALGLAETTPGPLILVTEFVGFLSAFGQGGFWYGIAGALLTLWVTFAPCFLWIFAGAPYIEWIGSQPRLAGALSAITAAVVGVILNLSVWFALHVFFAAVSRTQYGMIGLWVPDFGSISLVSIGLAVLGAVMLLRLHWNIILVLALMAALGMITGWI